MKNKYLLVIEETDTGFSGYCPDLPGFATTGETLDELYEMAKEGIAFHLEGLEEANINIKPHTTSTYIEVDVPFGL